MRDPCRRIVLPLLLAMVALTLAPRLAIPSIFALRVVDVNAVSADINGQLNICNPPTPCVNVKLQANASGPDTSDLTGTLLIYLTSPSAPQTCVGDMIASVVLQAGESATATLTGTLKPTNPTATSCIGNLQGLSVTLSVDGPFGFMRLTAASSSGETEDLAVGTGALVVNQNT